MRFALLFITAGLLHAEEITKVVDIKYADIARISSLIQQPKGAGMRIDPSGKLVVFQGDRLGVESMEEVLKKIDVPPANVELTFQLLTGSKAIGKPADLPPALNAVAKEMKNIFGFQTVTLIDAITVRTQEGKDADANGLLPFVDKDSPKASYQVRTKQVVVNGLKGNRLIRLGDLRFGATFHMNMGGANNQILPYLSSINTGLDMKEGQYIVVGRVGSDPASNPFFLVVSAKVVE